MAPIWGIFGFYEPHVRINYIICMSVFVYVLMHVYSYR